jgi:hypothetical protein
MTHPEQVASKKPRLRGFFFVRLLNPGANLMPLAFCRRRFRAVAKSTKMLGLDLQGCKVAWHRVC